MLLSSVELQSCEADLIVVMVVALLLWYNTLDDNSLATTTGI